MSKKNVRELAKKLDEEAYYKDLLEKSKRNSELGNRFGHGLLVFALHLLHITRLHFYVIEKERKIEGTTYEVEKCTVCGTERVKERRGDRDYREVFKGILGFILTLGGFGSAFVLEDILPSNLTSFPDFVAMPFFIVFIIHSIRCLIGFMKAV